MRWQAATLWLVCSCGGDGLEPEVRALLPGRGHAGEAVEIRGRGFAETGFVAFGAEVGTIVAWTDDRIRVMVPGMPSGVTTVVVTVDGRQSEPERFEVQP